MEWIKTSDRQPAEDQFVLAYGDACEGWVDGPKIAVFHWANDVWFDTNMDAYIAAGAPTHWMPLPDAPTTGDL